MAIIYTYSKVDPEKEDSVVITDASDNNYTKTALLSDVVSLATTYDLSSALNGGGNVDLKLIGSDGSVDIVEIIGGTDISITDTGSNITINSTAVDTNTTYNLTGAANGVTPANMDIILTGSDASVDTVTLVAGANITLTDLAGNNLQIDAPATGGTVTSVGATNAMGVASGITFVTNPAPITGAGTVDLSFGGTVGDMLYANTTTSMKVLGIGTSTTNPTGSVSNQVLVVDPIGPFPSWANKEIAIQDEGVNVELATKLINFTGAGVIASTTGAGLVEVAIAGGGGGVSEAEGIFTPILVTQGLDGTGTLEDLNGLISGFVYTAQEGHYYIINKQVYIDFWIEFELGPEAAALPNTLGVSAFDVTGTTPASNVLGLQGIDPLAAGLSTSRTNNAGVDITDVESNMGVTPSIRGWDHAPQGGKLNKFYGVGSLADKSVAWFHWLSQPVLGGEIRTEYNVSVGTWANQDGDKTFIIAGSLNPTTFNPE